MRTSKFKVGDPVKVITKRHGDEQFGKTGTVAEIGQLGDLDIEISYDEPFGCLEKNQYASRDLELVYWDHDPRKAKPLKIEAGKFYRTRDGRKVGPMEEGRYGGWFDKSKSLTGYPWDANGVWLEGQTSVLDLIAEWTTSCAAAQVDNLRDEYGPVGSVAAAGNDNSKPLTLGDILASALRKPKFKVGDRVIHKSEKARGVFDPGVVTSLENNEVKVDWQKYGRNWTISIGNVDAFMEHLVGATPAIVCLIENGQPKPSTYPHVHPSRGHAGDEAARLARKYPGKEFGVYELVDTRQVAKPAYLHEWQRLAADGEKIYAIKELRSMTGMTLKGAKEAVEHWLAVGEPYSRLAA